MELSVKGFRDLMDDLNEPINRIISPQFAGELYALAQVFTAFVAGFAITAFVVAEPHIGLVLCALGVACVLPAWLIASLAARMALEIGLAMLALHHQINRYAQTPPTNPPEKPSGGPAIER